MFKRHIIYKHNDSLLIIPEEVNKFDIKIDLFILLVFHVNKVFSDEVIRYFMRLLLKRIFLINAVLVTVSKVKLLFWFRTVFEFIIFCKFVDTNVVKCGFFFKTFRIYVILLFQLRKLTTLWAYSDECHFLLYIILQTSFRNGNLRKNLIYATIFQTCGLENLFELLVYKERFKFNLLIFLKLHNANLLRYTFIN